MRRKITRHGNTRNYTEKINIRDKESYRRDAKNAEQSKITVSEYAGVEPVLSLPLAGKGRDEGASLLSQISHFIPYFSRFTSHGFFRVLPWLMNVVCGE